MIQQVKNDVALIPAVAYIRMSTEQQEDSPARQRAEINRLAERDGFDIQHWYEDHGLTGTEGLNRPEFQKMLSDAEGGNFKAILMYEQSRFSRQDVFEVMPYWGQLKKAGVRLITCQSGEIKFDDLGGLLTAIVGQHGARSESLTIAKRSVSGKRQKLENGQYIAGAIFGYDRVFCDETGKQVNRVSFREKFRKSISWRCQLIPSREKQAVEAVQYAFTAIQNGYRISDVLRHFRQQKLKTAKNKNFCYRTVERILKNPIYTGRIISGRSSNGKFSRIDSDGLIIAENTHPALVSVDQFEEVQAILNGRQKSITRSDPGTFLLSRLIYCQTCGSMFHCMQATNGSGVMSQYYKCSGGSKHPKTKCVPPTVTAEDLERAVLDSIKRHLLTDENLKRCWEAYSNPEKSEKVEQNHQCRIDELREMVESAQRNLALATRPEDFAAISNQLQEWKTELRNLQKQSVQEPSKNSKIKPLAIVKLRECRDHIEESDRMLLSAALEKVVDRILIKRVYTASRRRITTAKIVFKPDVYFGEPIEVADHEITRRPWRVMAQWVIDQQRLVSLREISEACGCGLSNVSNRMKRAIEVGIVQKVHGKGWADAELELDQTQWRDVVAWVRRRKNPTSIDHVMKRFELHRRLANAHMRYGVEHNLLKKIGMAHWVDINSDMKSTGYEDVIGWAKEQNRICTVAETAEEFGINESHIRGYFSKATEEGELAHHCRRGWASLSAEVPYLTAEDVADYCHETQGHFDVGEICDVLDVKPPFVYKTMRKLTAMGVVTKGSQSGWDYNTTV